MSRSHTSMKVRNVPQHVKRWLERQLAWKLPVSYELSVWLIRPMPRKKSDAWWAEHKREWRLREQRLKRIATRMRKAGMGERDVSIVRNAGRIERD